MSSPIQIPYSSHNDAFPSLYVPVHRRTPSAYASSSGSLTPSSSPASSSRALSPSPSPSTCTGMPGVYTPAQLLALSHSPLSASHGTSMVDALRAVAPEVVQTRKRRKALAWRERQMAPHSSRIPTPTHRRTSSRGSQSHSESEEEKAVSWRRV